MKHVKAGSRTLALTAGYAALKRAAADRKPVTGWTHNFYRYPARFSPRFAEAAIAMYSKPGDLVLDPYMGGGTAVVEGVTAGRHVVGNDLNSLAAFVARVKVTTLSRPERLAIEHWLAHEVPKLSFRCSTDHARLSFDLAKTKNLTLPRARFIKKAVGIALGTIMELPSRAARDFAKCVLLRVSQLALDGRERHTPLSEFRDRLTMVGRGMLDSLNLYAAHVVGSGGQATILNLDAQHIDEAPIFSQGAARASLVVTSPPYPGVHVLYHRWQVDGRRETPAPYWIAGCKDGQGAAFYNFGDRRETAANNYFCTSLATLQTVRRVVRDGAYIIQLIAFNRPKDQLPRYLGNMAAAGFAEVSVGAAGRFWRRVPHRKWHAELNGTTHSSNEVVLVHQAI